MKVLFPFLVFSLLIVGVGCSRENDVIEREEEAPIERMGDNLEDGAEEAGDNIEDAGEELDD